MNVPCYSLLMAFTTMPGPQRSVIRLAGSTAPILTQPKPEKPTPEAENDEG
jgi:hypothetical protein